MITAPRLAATWVLCASLPLTSTRAAETAAAPVRQSRDDAAIAATLSIDRTHLSTAEHATLTLDTALKRGFRLRALNLEALKGTEWEIKTGASTPSRTDDAGRAIQRTELLLEALGPGDIELPALKLEYLPETGDEASVRTIAFDPVKFVITSVRRPDEANAELAERRDVVEPGADWRRWAIGGAGAAAALIAATALIWLAVRRHRARALEPIRRPAHELALERLDALLASDLLPLGRIKAFHAELSVILRQYIEDRFDLHAPDRTTEEFLAEVRAPTGPGANTLHADDVTVLARFLSHCDLVKFAEQSATEADAAEAVRTVREFIERTRAPDKLVELPPEHAGDAGSQPPSPHDRSAAEAAA